MQSSLPKQSISTHKNNSNNEHTVNQLPSQLHTNHCNEIEKRPRKKTTFQWSITSLKSQQIVNCDDFTVKVNI